MPESGGASQTSRSISPPVLPSHGCVGDTMPPCRPSQPMPAGPPHPRRGSRRCRSKEVSRRLLNFVSLSRHGCQSQAHSDEVAPDAEARARRRELHCRRREELRPMGMKQAGEDVMKGRRENCAKHVGRGTHSSGWYW
jgi:hypothetical protein